MERYEELINMTNISDVMLKLGELHIDEYLDGKRHYLVDIPKEMGNVYLLIDTEALCKLHRTLIVTEHYETAKIAQEEIERRGYVVTIFDKHINYKKCT